MNWLSDYIAQHMKRFREEKRPCQRKGQWETEGSLRKGGITAINCNKYELGVRQLQVHRLTMLF